MRLTIITVVKDDASGLADTIRSIDDQGIEEAVEHLIIDSSTPSVAIDCGATSYVSRRLESIPPEGVYPAMNRGLDLAAGDYVWFLNAGDTLVDPSTLQRVCRMLDSSPTWVVGRVGIIDRSGKRVDSSRWDFATEKRRAFARGHFPPHQATIVRTSHLRNLGGFDTRYRVAADYQAALKLARGQAPVMTDLVLAQFREGGLSTVRWKSAHREFHKARREVMPLRGASSLMEYWNTGVGFCAEWVHRSLLRADR